jgi:hypothetical protein
MTSTTAIELKKSINKAYVNVYLKRRLTDGNFESDWLDITRLVLSSGIDALSYSVDSGDFDVGVFSVSNVRLNFDNRTGKFNDNEDSRSLWGSLNTRQLSRIKVEAGYLDAYDEKLTENVFEGIIDERSFTFDVKQDTVSCTVLSREYAFQTVNVAGGSLGLSPVASDAIYTLCNRPEITDYMTVTLANIVPANDIVIDSPNEWAGKKLNDVLNEIMLVTNSILYIDKEGNLIVSGRDHSRRVAYEFRQNSNTGKPDNIYPIRNVNSGRQRVKNYISWGSGVSAVTASSTDEFLERYGVTKRTISCDAITSATTKAAIVANVLAEWQFPKQEMEIETDYLANEIGFFDLVTVDFIPQLTRKTNLPICGEAICGSAIAVDYASGFKTDVKKGYKVLSIEHSLSEFKTSLKIREIGKQLNDGYVYMILSKSIPTTFAAETYKDINVAAYSMNAQRCLVQVVDPSGSYVTGEFTVTRPSTSIVRITSGIAITGTYNILCSEVEA